MTIRFDAYFNSMRLYNGRRSVYLSVTLGRRTWFVSRWDTVRVLPKVRNVDLYRGAVMTWYAGAF